MVLELIVLSENGRTGVKGHPQDGPAPFRDIRQPHEIDMNLLGGLFSPPKLCLPMSTHLGNGDFFHEFQQHHPVRVGDIYIYYITLGFQQPLF